WTTSSSTQAAAFSSRRRSRHEGVLHRCLRLLRAVRGDRGGAGREDCRGRWRGRRLRPRRALHRPRRGALHARAPEAPLLGGKLRGFERVIDAPALFAIGYGEIASSLYIALGIVAGAALGFTPLVLLVTGAIFVLVSLSYAEGTAALPETGGAATFVRRAFNDLAGFVTGWVLFLDFLIVMALSALFVPHYFAGAFGADSLRQSPWDAIVGGGV